MGSFFFTIKTPTNACAQSGARSSLSGGLYTQINPLSPSSRKPLVWSSGYMRVSGAVSLQSHLDPGYRVCSAYAARKHLIVWRCWAGIDNLYSVFFNCVYFLIFFAIYFGLLAQVSRDFFFFFFANLVFTRFGGVEDDVRGSDWL